MFQPDPKPVKKEKEVLTARQFREKYGQKRSTKKGTKKSGKPKTEYSKKIKEADDWFSRRVRLEAAHPDGSGLGRCISCPRTIEIKYNDCGHYHSRKHLATRWETKNCDLQCKRCNEGMGDPRVNNAFKGSLIRKYGKEEFEKLEIRSRNIFRFTVFELDLIIQENKEIVEKLLKEKGLRKWW